MRLEGSCHCGAVRFSVDSPHPYPFNLCYCSICRKTSGSGGYAINLSAHAATMQITGEEHTRIYQARVHNTETGGYSQSPAQRRFCSRCGSPLWLWDPRWPELVHPSASAIDTELPCPPERTHAMLDSKANWVVIHPQPQDRLFQGYPDESIAEWHQRLGLEQS